MRLHEIFKKQEIIAKLTSSGVVNPYEEYLDTFKDHKKLLIRYQRSNPNLSNEELSDKIEEILGPLSKTINDYLNDLKNMSTAMRNAMSDLENALKLLHEEINNCIEEGLFGDFDSLYK